MPDSWRCCDEWRAHRSRPRTSSSRRFDPRTSARTRQNRPRRTPGGGRISPRSRRAEIRRPEVTLTGRFLRPIVWFAAASMLTTIVHESAHAATAFVLGVRSTLFNYSAHLDLTHAQSASNLPAIIAVAGPVVCLAIGILCWV